MQALGKAEDARRTADARADELKYRLGVSDFLLAGAAYDNGDVGPGCRTAGQRTPGPARLGMALPEAANARRPVHALWPHGRSVERGVQPRRHADRLRQCGRDGEGLGRADGDAPARAERAHGTW